MTYGSLNNRIMESATPTTPEVGMGATITMWSDRHAYTIVEVKSPSTIVIQQDIATRTDKNGMSDSQTYEFKANPDGAKFNVTRRRDGKWKVAGSTQVVVIGHRSEYHDFSF